MSDTESPAPEELVSSPDPSLVPLPPAQPDADPTGSSHAGAKTTARQRVKLIASAVRGRITEAARSVRARLARVRIGLQPLTPTFIRDQHGSYSDELLAVLRGRRRKRKLIWNIALTGGYGSGKSSVLAEVRRRLPRRAVEVSLSSLSDIGVTAQPNGDDINNTIQKEVVKQLLYRERPGKVPGSRFRRISRMPKRRAVVTALLIGATASGLLWLSGWGAPFDLSPADEDRRIWLHLAVGLGVAVVAFIAQLLAHNRVRIDKLGAANTSITLAADSKASYFDEYLDEIVYFFEKTRRDVVIIEDLDRFEDPEIYASLRALNTVLNTSRQLRRRPVHFVYAVRDSIFEDLERLSKDGKPAIDPEEPDADRQRRKDLEDLADIASPATSVWQSNRSLSDAATQRTKFFDLVIPIVPFITHRTSKDLLKSMLESVDPDVSLEVITAVAKHVTDMRLLRNIVNEFRVFHLRVIAPKKLVGLTSSGLFAMVAFKNTHLEDFERIRVGASSLDQLYRVARKTIDDHLKQLALDLQDLRSSGNPVASEIARASELGSALQALAERWKVRLAGGSPEQTRYRVNSDFINTAELATPSFWSSVIDGGTVIEVWDSSADVFRLDAAALRSELGRLIPDRWIELGREQRQAELNQLIERRSWFRKADFKELSRELPPIEVQLAERLVPFEKAVDALTPDPLLKLLVVEGFIDRNFPLYSSEFHGGVSSANAITFVVQHVQPDEPSHNYELSDDDVVSVIREVGDDLFGSAGMYNIPLYNHLLANGDARFDENIQLLATGREIDLEFIDAYLAGGAHPDVLMKRLAPYWSTIFDHLSKNAHPAEADLLELIVAAFEGGDPAREYEVPASVQAKLEASYKSIRDLVDEGADSARGVAMLQRLGVRLPSLQGLSEETISEVIAARQYRISVPTLQGVLNRPEVGLDEIYQTDSATFDHVLLHIDEYMDELDKAGLPSMTTATDLLAIVEAVENAHSGASERVLRKMAPGVELSHILGAPTDVMTALGASRRFALTAVNLRVYLDALGMDESILAYLEAKTRIDRTDALPDPQTETLASELVNEVRLAPSTRATLVASLTNSFPVGRLSSREPDLIRELVGQSMLEQSASSLATFGDSVDAQEALILASSEPSTYFSPSGASNALRERLLRNPDVDPEMKAAIAQSILDSGTPTDGVLEALAEWSVSSGLVLGAPTLQAIQTSSASVDAKLGALDVSHGQISVPQLREYIQALPDPYPRLLERSNRPVELPGSPNMSNVLDVLMGEEGGAVSTWDRNGDSYRVNMHRPQRD